MWRFGIALFAGCGFHGATPLGPADADDVPDTLVVPVDAMVAIDASSTDAPIPVDAIALPTCTDRIQNGNETDLDCGGSCKPCEVGEHCAVPADCDLSTCGSGTCRLAAQCKELHAAHPELGSAAYAIGSPAVTTYCDMTVDGGGWTLVGKVDAPHDMSATWLVSAVNASALSTPMIAANSVACLDAVDLAVNRSTELRLSNSTASKWVKWPLPAGRTAAKWWNHAAGQVAIGAATQTAVTVTAQDGSTMACFQNIYGIIPYAMHGGAYPFASYNTGGNTLGSDTCMAVGTMKMGAAPADGFTQNGNGFDAPSDETTWPNPAYNVSPHVAVWLR